jgi:hypothetical protein
MYAEDLLGLTRFTVVDLFADRTVRRPLIVAFLMMLSVTFAFWGVAEPLSRPMSALSPPRAAARLPNGRLGRA